MKISNLNYIDHFSFAEVDDHLEISGIAFRSGKIENKKVFVDDSELNPIAKSMKDIPLIDSHQKETIKSTVGKVISGWVDKTYVKYKAKILDEDTIKLVKNGLVKGVSCGLSYEREDTLEDGYIQLSGLKCRELSLTNFPALPEASINWGEFSLEIVTKPDLEPTPDVDTMLENLAIVAYNQLKKKYDHLLNMYKENDADIQKLNKENQTLKKQLEYLRTYGFEIPEKYLEFNLETLLLYGELMSEARNAAKTLGAVQDEEDYTDPKLEAKEALKDMIFDRDDPKKDIRTFSDWQKKYGNLGDFK